MTVIGSEFHTGERAPVSGVYQYVRHVSGSCGYTPAEKEIPLSKGEIFPPHRSCSKSVVWKLIRYA